KQQASADIRLRRHARRSRKEHDRDTARRAGRHGGSIRPPHSWRNIMSGMARPRTTTNARRLTPAMRDGGTVAGLLARRPATKKHQLRPTTYQNYTWTVQKRIIPALGNTRVRQLTAMEVQRWYSDLLDAGHSARTVQMCHMQVKQALKYAVRWGLADRNVCDD